MNRKLRNILTLVAACLVLVWCIPSVGQVLKGSISGTVQDPQGAVVSGATVKATSLATGNVLTTTSDSSGLFRFNLIPAGDYKVEVAAQGFKTAVQNNVAVVAGRDTGLGGMKLTVGETSTTVEVTAEAPLIETSQAQVTNTFSGVTLQTFAGIQENQGLDNLALFVPGVASTRDSFFSNANGGVGFSVNGLRGRNNDQQIDGQNNNDNSVAGPGLFVSDTEWVQQYVLITNNFGPEYGRNAGSVVNIITKSGSNAWHGSVYGTENNSVMNSMTNQMKNPNFGNDLTHPPRLNDEFSGFSLGGPIAKNKLFIFGGFDNEIASTSTVYSSGAFTPTPAGIATLSGCFPGSASLAALSKFGPYAISAGNPVTTSTQVVDFTAKQTGSVPCAGVELGTLQRQAATPAHFYNFPLRLDWQRANDTIMARYIYNRTTFFGANDNGAAGYIFNEPALSQAMLLSWTRNLTSRMVNEARVSFGRLNVEFGGSSIGSPEPSADQLSTALANITFNNTGANLGFGPATNLPQQRIVNTWQAQDNWNYVWGKHTIKAGVNWTYQRSPNIFLPNINGQYRFSNWGAFGANNPNRIRLANGPSQLDFREYDTFVYGGDDWKISQNLTLNLGLTWTYYGQPANLFNDITVPRESNPATAFWASTEPTGTDVLHNTFSNPGAAIPLSVRTDPKVASPKNNFGPTFGFAYSPQWGGFLTGNGKTVIRGGYRYLYDPPYYNIYLNESTATPMTFLNTIPAPGTHPMPAVPTGPNVRAALAPAIQKGVFDPREFAFTNITPNFGADRVHSWSLGFEREVTKNAAVEVRYAGNHAYGLFQTLDANPYIADLKRDFPSLVPAGLTPCTTPLWVNSTIGNTPGEADPTGRLDCNHGVVRTRANSGFSNYHALQTEFRANNLFKQLTIRTGYTFAKNLDNASEIFSTGGAGNTVFFAQNPANQVNGKGEYSFSGLDFRHTWSLTAAEQLPFFKEQHGLVGHVLGGWTVSATYLMQSGQRYTPAQFGDAAGTAAGDYYDLGYINNFAGVDTARPFLGNLSAPQTAVGIFAGDACAIFATDATAQSCTMNPTTLISLNSANATGAGVTLDASNNPIPAVTVDKNQVRFIMNAGTAQTVFGTPFGNTPRNPVTDAISNIGNFSLYKKFKISERVSFDFHATALNAFNHPNYQSIDPFIDDAGFTGFFNGFGDPKLTDDIPGTVNFPVAASRRVLVGGTIRF